MNQIQSTNNGRLLLTLGGFALVIHLVVFQNSLGIVADPGVSGLSENILSGGLLVMAVVCFVGGLYLTQRKP